MVTNDGGPAFPGGYHPSTNESTPDDCYPFYDGMSLRDYFAGQVLAGIMSQGTVQLPEKAAGCAYLWADAMLEAREK